MAMKRGAVSKGSDKRKQSLYFPEAMLQEIKDERVVLSLKIVKIFIIPFLQALIMQENILLIGS